jgi:predicted Zn-dependent protease with MMP-like domain
MVTDDDEFIDAIVLKTAAELAIGDRDDSARATLAELDGCVLDHPDLLCTVAEMWLELADDAAAEGLYLAAIGCDDSCADAHYGLGLIHEGRGQRTAMIAAWLKTRSLDRAAPKPPWHLADTEFETVVEAALAELPGEIIAHLENVPIMVEELPAADLVSEGYDPRLLGLFSGTPLPDKSHVAEQHPHVDTIELFQSNLERACGGRAELAAEIRITLIHETAHFFGLEDSDLDRIGLG